MQLSLRDRIRLICVVLYCSLVMQTLTQLKPGLADDISKRCGVYVDGYGQHSTQVSFSGTSENVRQAREEFERQVSSVFLYNVPKETPLRLLNSAVKLLQNDGLSIAVLEDDAGTHVGSFSNADIEKLKRVLQRKPYQNSVPVHEEVSSHSEDALEELCSSDCVRVRKEEEKILIEGFVKEDVQQARALLQKSIKVVMSSSHSLVCTPEQEAYLLHVLTSKKCSDRAQQLKASLPASLYPSKEKRKIFLKGTQDERDVCTKVLLESVPVHYRTCPFTCHPAFYSQMERQVLKQHVTVESIKVEEAQEEKKEGKKEAHKFSVILFANNATDLESAVRDLKVGTGIFLLCIVKDN